MSPSEVMVKIIDILYLAFTTNGINVFFHYCACRNILGNNMLLNELLSGLISGNL